VAQRRLHLELRSPTHLPVAYETEEVVIPGAAGVFTVLPGHTPLLTALGKGVIAVYEADSEPRFFAVHDGFAEVLDDRILVLADTMEIAEEIDLARAEAAGKRAEERLRKPSDDTDIARAESALERSLARLQARRGQEF